MGRKATVHSAPPPPPEEDNDDDFEPEEDEPEEAHKPKATSDVRSLADNASNEASASAAIRYIAKFVGEGLDDVYREFAKTKWSKGSGDDNTRKDRQNISIVLSNARRARGETGPSQSSNASSQQKSSTEVTFADMKAVKNLAAEMGGIEQLTEEVGRIEALASQVGGLEKLKNTLEALRELTF